LRVAASVARVRQGDKCNKENHDHRQLEFEADARGGDYGWRMSSTACDRAIELKQRC
jgi:hypothetical protein